MAGRDEVHGRPRAGGAADGDADRPVARREHEERRREDGPRPLLGVAEEAPRPFAGLDAAEREVGELARDVVEPTRHQVEVLAVGEAERRPVELVVGNEADVVSPAPTGEADAIDGRVRRAWQPLELAKRRQRHARLAADGAGEGVPARERVVHGGVVIGTSDGDLTPLRGISHVGEPLVPPRAPPLRRRRASDVAEPAVRTGAPTVRWRTAVSAQAE